ncbi:hypothetical protein HPB47_005652 [Ixodes persulcatus]|uniref:Uncharacterized protein n=1 Tax=Ixodes persulcatus TaxID=34615 RepID=A0AC60PCJ3_IXOPE|nr:hypothetical protein HPB47_005652 [Ixodes persulcatus]
MLRLMPHGKDVCGPCSVPIKRQPFIVCSGPCSRTFHCLCLGVRNEDNDLLVAKEVSTFKCFALTKRHDPESVVLETNPPSNDSAVNNGTPQEMQQEPTSCKQFELRQLVAHCVGQYRDYAGRSCNRMAAPGHGCRCISKTVDVKVTWKAWCDNIVNQDIRPSFAVKNLAIALWAGPVSFCRGL